MQTTRFSVDAFQVAEEPCHKAAPGSSNSHESHTHVAPAANEQECDAAAGYGDEGAEPNSPPKHAPPPN